MDHDDTTGGDRLPVVRPSVAPVPVDRTTELARSTGSPLGVPMLAAEMMRATASVMTQAMSVMMRPWLIGVPVRSPDARDRSGPGVHVSYTHVELHWPNR